MSLTTTFERVEEKLHGVLVGHSITALRLTVGAVFCFVGFGILKFFPSVSPAQGLSIKTIDLLTFGVIPWRAEIVAIAMLECFIGICLLVNRWMRLAVWLLAVEFVGILAPLALLPGRQRTRASAAAGVIGLKDAAGRELDFLGFASTSTMAAERPSGSTRTCGASGSRPRGSA